MDTNAIREVLLNQLHRILKWSGLHILQILNPTLSSYWREKINIQLRPSAEHLWECLQFKLCFSILTVNAALVFPLMFLQIRCTAVLDSLAIVYFIHILCVLHTVTFPVPFDWWRGAEQAGAAIRHLGWFYEKLELWESVWSDILTVFKSARKPVTYRQLDLWAKLSLPQFSNDYFPLGKKRHSYWIHFKVQFQAR